MTTEQRPLQAKTQSFSAKLVPIFILRIRLPSKYLLQETGTITIDDEKTGEIRLFADPRASQLETIRRRAYERINRFFCVAEDFGVWVAVSDDVVREVQELGRYVRESLQRLGFGDDVVSRYDVKVIKVYLEPDDARTLLSSAVKRLSEEVATLEKRMRDAEREQKKSTARRLLSDLEHRRALLETFRRYLSTI